MRKLFFLFYRFICQVEPFDGREMASWRVEDPNLELECSCLGRGRGYYDEVERRQYEIETLAVRSWRVDEFDVTSLGDDWNGQFYAGDTFVFRWMYKVSLTGGCLLLNCLTVLLFYCFLPGILTSTKFHQGGFYASLVPGLENERNRTFLFPQ